MKSRALLSACSLCLLPMHEIVKSNRQYKVLCYRYKKKILWDTKTNNLETYHSTNIIAKRTITVLLLLTHSRCQSVHNVFHNNHAEGYALQCFH